MSTSPTLRSIQYLRGLAALSVTIYHAGQWAGLDLHLGAAGVDVFFVISGFILWTVTREPQPSPVDFLWRRGIRILPLYWLMTLATLAVAAIVPGRLADVDAEPGHVIASLLLIPHLNPDGLPFPVMVQGWTLTYEAFFYVLLAATLAAPRALQGPLLAAALIGTLAIGYFNAPAYLLLANGMLLEFGAGVLLAVIAARGGLPQALGGAALLLTAIAGFAWAGLSFPDDPGNWRVIAWGFPSVLAVAGFLALERGGALLRLPGLMTLGAASYALYLAHRLIIALVSPIVVEFTPTWPWLVLSLSISAALVAGLMLHVWVERPLLAALKGEPGTGSLGWRGAG